MSCPRVGKLFGCKFRPRYDRVPPTPEQIKALTDDTFGPPFTHTLAAMTAARYVADVCERCGKTVERQIEITGSPESTTHG